MLPIGELRLGIPLGIIGLNLHWVPVFIMSLIGNLIPVLPILIVLNWVPRIIPHLPSWVNKLWVFQNRRVILVHEKYSNYVSVNNAGTNVTTRSIMDTDVQAWRMILEVNLTSAYILTKAVLPGMMKQECGTIINIASKAASNPSLVGGVAYSSSKRGMEALTVVTNQEGNPRNVRATVLNPGEGNTPILDRRSAPPNAESRSVMIQPQDLADLVVLVATLPQNVTVETVDLRPTKKRSAR